MKRRVWGEGQPAFDESLIYIPCASSGHVETVNGLRKLKQRMEDSLHYLQDMKEKKTLAQISFSIV